jgi:hypothetical protein
VEAALVVVVLWGRALHGWVSVVDVAVGQVGSRVELFEESPESMDVSLVSRIATMRSLGESTLGIA